jgi:hypothetical protein
MHKISFTALAVMIMIGFGVWAGALTTAGALTADPVIDQSGPASATDLLPAVVGQ